VESGFRGDYHSSYGFFPLPRLSFLYRFHSSLTARVNGGFGYKIPNIVTYTDPEAGLASLSPGITLQPELSQGINADVNFQRLFFNRVTVTLNQSFFLTGISHPVFDSSTAANRVALANAGRSLRTQGLQTYGRVRWSRMELYLGYVFTAVEKLYEPAHPLLPVTPRHNFSSTFFYEPSRSWRFGIESSLIGGQLDQDYRPVKDYVIFAAMVQYSVKHLTFVLNGENLLDFRQSRYGKIYDGPIGNPVFHKLWAPTDGRVINLSVRWSL